MNSKKAKEIAKKRLQGLFTSNKGNDNRELSKIKWDINKEFNLNFHDKSLSDQDIILNPDTFQGVEENDFIEIISTTNSEIRIIFKIKNQSLDRIKTSISVLSVYNELMKNHNENFNKSSVFVRIVANINDYFVENVVINFKEQFLCRKDIFQIIQGQINNIVYVNKDIKLMSSPPNDEIRVGKISSFRASNGKRIPTGLVTSSTEFKLRSLSAGIYFLIEISKDTYDFSINSKTKFEMIIEYLKNTINLMKQSQCYHIINIIFFTRIYFKFPDEKFNLLQFNINKQFKCVNINYIFKSSIFPQEFFFDVYSNIMSMNINKLDTKDMIKILYDAFNIFCSIFKVKNLSEYMSEIQSRYNKYSSSRDFKDTFSKKIQFSNFNNLYSSSFFESINEFRMTKSVTSNIFEAVNLIVNDLKYEKKKLNKLGNIITVISSGEYFPYYNEKLSKFTKESIYEEGIPLCVVILGSKSKATHICNKYNFNKEESKDIIGDYKCSTFRFKENENLEMINSNDSLSFKFDLLKEKLKIEYSTYIYEADVFSLNSPKWIKIFFLNTCYSRSKCNDENLKLRDITNKSLNTSENEFTRYNYNSSKPTRKFSLSSPYEKTHDNYIDNDIFNSKKLTQVNGLSYEDLINVNSNKNSFLSSKNKEDLEFLSSLKESLNIYNSTYNRMKNFEGELENENSHIGETPQSNSQNISEPNEINNHENYKEFVKKTNEYENEIFSRKISKINSFDITCDKSLPNKTGSGKISKSRNVLKSYEFSVKDDDFSNVLEILTCVPLLSIFGELYPNESTEDVTLSPHQISSLNPEVDCLEEIFYERLNSNYQIVKMKNYYEDFNKPIDLKKIGLIELIDRRYKHKIAIEDQNIKIDIYDYKKKNKTASNQTEEVGSYSLDSIEINRIQYTFLIYDFKLSIFLSKKIVTSVGEKNDVFWQNSDKWLYEPESSKKNIKYKNEMNFLLIDKYEELLKKRKIFINIIQKKTKDDSSNQFNQLCIGELDNPILPCKTSTDCIEINYTNQHSTEESFETRLMSLIANIENYLLMYYNLKANLSDRISYTSNSENTNFLINPLWYSILSLNQSSDWIFLTHNSLFNKKNPFFFSIKWLSCSSMPIYNFHKDLMKKSRNKNIGLIKLPCVDKASSSFNRISLWKFPENKNLFLDLILSKGLLSKFLRCQYGEKVVYYSDDFNLFVNISHSEISIQDNIVENSHDKYENYFLKFSSDIDNILDIFDIIDKIIEKIVT